PFTAFATGSSIRGIHKLFTYGLVGLVVLHVFGVVFESVRTRESLTRAMVTGRKRARPDSEAVPSVRARPVLALAGFSVIALITAGAVVHFAAKPALGVPTAPIDATYAKECGSCHSVHHPTVAPAATWRAVFADLRNHFGDNASLDPETTKQLASYAIANAAEHWDTRVAHVMRVRSEDKPLRITDVKRWKRIHRHFPEKLFKSKPIGGKLNCTNCHRDAETGVFATRNIAIKKEKTK
ncbi:MAG: hypothetical protein P8Y36_06550, partial [Alphaproteobacteria bacterium]